MSIKVFNLVYASTLSIIGQLRGNKKYRLAKKLGSGSFGDIYLGQHVTTGDEVAVKLEPVSDFMLCML
jgi:serine/threonine protein kinase